MAKTSGNCRISRTESLAEEDSEWFDLQQQNKSRAPSFMNNYLSAFATPLLLDNSVMKMKEEKK